MTGLFRENPYGSSWIVLCLQTHRLTTFYVLQGSEHTQKLFFNPYKPAQFRNGFPFIIILFLCSCMNHR